MNDAASANKMAEAELPPLHIDNIVATFCMRGYSIHAKCRTKDCCCQPQRHSTPYNGKIKAKCSTLPKTYSDNICLQKLVNNGHGLLCYDPRRFATVTYHSCHPRFTALIFGTAQAVMTGTRSIEAARAAAHSMTRLCNECGLETAHVSDFAVQNIVANCNLRQQVDLVSMHENVSNSTYNPDIFPGLRLRISNTKTGANIFRNGTVIITGCKTICDIQHYWAQIHSQIVPYFLSGHAEDNSMYATRIGATRRLAQDLAVRMLDTQDQATPPFNQVDSTEHTARNENHNASQHITLQQHTENVLMSMCDSGVISRAEVEMDHYNIMPFSCAHRFLKVKQEQCKSNQAHYKTSDKRARFTIKA